MAFFKGILSYTGLYKIVKTWRDIKDVNDAYQTLNISPDTMGYASFIEQLIYKLNSEETFMPGCDGLTRKLYLPIVKLKQTDKNVDRQLAFIKVNNIGYKCILPEKNEIPEINGLFNYDKENDVGFCSLHAAKLACISKELAYHISKYFSAELCMAMCLKSDVVHGAIINWHQDIETIDKYEEK